MSQDPLRSIRRHVPASKGTFPDAVYASEWLEPAREAAEELFEAAVGEIYAAHVVMLGEQRILDDALVVRLLQYLAVPNDRAEAAPRQVLGRLHGHARAAESGALLTALAQEEVLVAAGRLVLRERVLGLGAALLGARESIAELASANLTTLMLATANGQVVQPTSLGHYLAGHLGPLGRVQTRLQESYARVNRSPLGAVSGMSTAMPIRRGRVADLLGFDGVIDNTTDAVASMDVAVELSSLVSGAAIEMSRLVADVAYWARDDVGLLVPGDAFVHAGAAQPQRRDPLVIDHLRVATARLVGAAAELTPLVAGQHGLGGDAVRVQAFQIVERQLVDLERMYRLLSGVMRTANVNRAMFANRTNRGFATSSELADLLTVDFDVPRAQAYELVERIVIEATEQGIDATTLTAQFVDQVALRCIGREVGIEPEMLARCLSPKRFIERRTVTGAPAPRSVGQALERESFATRKDRGWLTEREAALAWAERGLRARVDEVVRDSSAILRRPERAASAEEANGGGTIR